MSEINITLIKQQNEIIFRKDNTTTSEAQDSVDSIQQYITELILTI